MATPPVFRFAPSPNGRLHLGHAFAALYGYDLCRRHGGRFLLRIEDIDPVRSKQEFVDGILDDLAWLGLTWEEPVRRQSDRMAAYRDALERLRQRELVYPAFMSRSETASATSAPDWPRDPDGAPLYPPHDRGMSSSAARARIEAGDAHAWRLNASRAIDACPQLTWRETGAGPNGETGPITADPARWGDVMIARRDVPTTYHLAVVLDDADQGVTHVVRGEDLFHATSVHRLLQCLLGLPAPVYHHHRLITDRGGDKLSKSLKSQSLAALRDDGLTAGDIRQRLGLGASGPAYTPR